jgi:hypothetical protein
MLKNLTSGASGMTRRLTMNAQFNSRIIVSSPRVFQHGASPLFVRSLATTSSEDRGDKGKNDDRSNRAGKTSIHVEATDNKPKFERQLQESQLDEIEKRDSAGAPIPETLQAQSKQTLAKDKNIEDRANDTEPKFHVWGFSMGSDGRDPQVINKGGDSTGQFGGLTNAAKNLLLQLRQLNEIEADLIRDVSGGGGGGDGRSKALRADEGEKAKAPAKQHKKSKHALAKQSKNSVSNPFDTNNLFRLTQSLLPSSATDPFGFAPSMFHRSFDGFNQLEREFWDSLLQPQRLSSVDMVGPARVFVVWSSTSDDADEKGGEQSQEGEEGKGKVDAANKSESGGEAKSNDESGGGDHHSSSSSGEQDGESKIEMSAGGEEDKKKKVKD